MKDELVSVQESASHAARLAKVEFIPHAMMTYVSEVVKNMEKMHLCTVKYESFNAAIMAALSSIATEKRTFIATSRINIIEEMSYAPMMQLPLVMFTMARAFGFSGASTYDNIFALRDLGWIIICTGSHQEVVDSIIQAYMIAENNKVYLPVMITSDGIPSRRESVRIPSDMSVAKLLAKLKIKNKITAKSDFLTAQSSTEAVRIRRSMDNAVKVIQKVHETWKSKFKIKYDFIEEFYIDDAEYIFVISGSHAYTACSVVQRMRKEGKKVGMIRIRIFRPFPYERIAAALKNAKKVAVIDQSLASVLYREIKSCYYGPCMNFLSMGNIINEKDFIDIIGILEKNEKHERIWIT